MVKPTLLVVAVPTGLYVTVAEPGCDPSAVAVKFTAMMQLAPAARLFGDTGQEELVVFCV